MKTRISIKLKIVGIILIILIMVSGVGFLTYRQFSKVLESITEASKPDKRITLTKSLIYDLTQAENSVKTYTLTHDSVYLDNYHSLNIGISNKLSLLMDMKSQVPNEREIFDSLNNLIELKFTILDELLSIQNEFRVEQALDKVSRKVEQAVSDETNQKRIFDWKAFKSTSKKEKETLEEMTKDLQQIKRTETSKEMQQLERELELLMFDKRVTGNIQNLLSELEAADKKRVDQKAGEIKRAVRQTNIQILIFCIVISLLLIFMSYTIIRYITNTNRYRKALKKAKKEAESLAKAKEHFVATVSHEIRTPMNIISGFTEQLSKSNLKPQQKEQINIIRKASGHLLNLINEVLDFTKLENNKLTLEQNGFQPEEVIHEIIEFLSPLVDSKSIHLESHIAANVPKVLIGDSFRLRQILFNVMGNAVKFTEQGKITIEASSVLKNQDGTTLRIKIIDTGIGMNANKLSRVFREFEQAETSTARTYGGTGLGLAITKRLVELQQGTIEITSEEKVGTTVTLEIPYLIGNEKDLVETKEIDAATLDLSNTRILIVDDETFNRKLLYSILEKYNAIITEAKNGQEAIEETRKNNYDVILMDARMPKIDGITASKKILSIYRKKNIDIPIVALTAAVTQEDRKKYKAAGMQEFLAKPFKEAELINVLLKILQPDSKANIENPIPRKDNKQLDFNELKQISGADQDFYADMLETFIDNTKEGIDQMKEALKTQDFEEIAEIAHKISSPCKHLSANTLYNYLKEIEELGREVKQPESIERLVHEAVRESESVISVVQKELDKVR